jgi:hypothetical protein
MKNKTSRFSLFVICLAGKVEPFQIPANHNAVKFSFNVWETPYVNIGNSLSDDELAYHIFPGPTMVERGHHDLVQPGKQVAYEYG